MLIHKKNVLLLKEAVTETSINDLAARYDGKKTKRVIFNPFNGGTHLEVASAEIKIQSSAVIILSGSMQLTVKTSDIARTDENSGSSGSVVISFWLKNHKGYLSVEIK